MNPLYLANRFSIAMPLDEVQWPKSFAILTAHAPYGSSRTVEELQVAHERLYALLETWSTFLVPLTRHSPSEDQSVPSWAIAMEWDEAAKIGWVFKQEVLFLVNRDDLFVSYCVPWRHKLYKIGSFRERLFLAPFQLSRTEVSASP